jgi:hypothetical protein
MTTAQAVLDVRARVRSTRELLAVPLLVLERRSDDVPSPPVSDDVAQRAYQALLDATRELQQLEDALAYLERTLAPQQSPA